MVARCTRSGEGLATLVMVSDAGVLVTDTEFQRLQPSDRRRYFAEARRSLSLERKRDCERIRKRAPGLGDRIRRSVDLCDTRRVAVSGQLEHYSSDFRMDTAFINRVGLTRGWQYQGLSFYPDEKRAPWLKRINPFIWVTAADDRIQGGSELEVIPAIRFNFTRQGYLRLDMSRGHETFAHERFEVWSCDGRRRCAVHEVAEPGR